jgi:hypothetical protein
MHQSEVINSKAEQKIIDPLSASIIKTLLYFDIFNHPLTIDEIFRFMNYPVHSRSLLLNKVDVLSKKNLIGFDNGLYFLYGKNNCIDKRISGNLEAEKCFVKAKQMVKLISQFPFVKAVFISGSLSKGYMDGNSDIDYFVITSLNRLWLCRTLLMLYKKIFLLNSHKYFCLNYFITTDNLAIRDDNIFSAIELITLIPLYGDDFYFRLLENNLWIKKYFPNFIMKEDFQSEKKGTFFKKSLEKVLGGKPGSILDDMLFKLTVKFWKRKYSGADDEFFRENIFNDKNVCKYHPFSVRNKILTEYQNRIEAFEKENQIKLCHKYY